MQRAAPRACAANALARMRTALKALQEMDCADEGIRLTVRATARAEQLATECPTSQGVPVEVIHLGHNRSVAEIVDCAIQEDAQAIAVRIDRVERALIDLTHIKTPAWHNEAPNYKSQEPNKSQEPKSQ